MSTIRVVQYFQLLAFTSKKAAKSLAGLDKDDTIVAGKAEGTVIHRYQNYFVNQQKKFNGNFYAFAPFRVEGSVANTGGDNSLVQVLFPNYEIAIRLVEQGNGNRLSRLTLSTAWIREDGTPIRDPYSEAFLGLGASFSETTIELRFRSAMDSVGATFPGRTLSRSLIGILPLNADLRLR